MQFIKWMTAMFMASMLCAGSALAADTAAPVGGNAGKEELTDHSTHAGHAGMASDAATPVAGKEEQAGHAGHTDHSNHAKHDMKCCMEMGDKKCMEMGDKKCMEMGGKKCMEMGDKKCMEMGGKKCMEMGDKKCMEMGDKKCNCCKDCMKGNGKQCNCHKGKKNLHKSHDACDTMKGAAKSDEKKPDEKKPDGQDDTAKPVTKVVEPVLSEAEGRTLAQKSNCFGCHSIEKKMIGPALKDVAAKYRGDAGAEDKLIAKVSKGSSGVWGSVPMPANSPAVKDADIKALIKFTLSLK